MKFSEAIMLGSTTGHELGNDSWECCLVGMGVAALVETNLAKDEAIKRWPWLLNIPEHFPEELVYLRQHCQKPDGLLIATDLCGRILDGRMTLERAVDIIRSIEPVEDVEPQAPAVETTQEVTK